MQPSILTCALAVTAAIAAARTWRISSAHDYVSAGLGHLVTVTFWRSFLGTVPWTIVATLVLLAWIRWRWRSPIRLVDRTGVVLATVLLAGAMGTLPGASSSGPSTNVLLISIDTLRADHLGVYGYPRPTSPTLDTRLAAAGVVFEQAISQSPKTTPSHLTMLTGLSPCAHGVGMWDVDDRRYALSPRVHTLAEYLRNAGYHTVAFTAGGHVHRTRGLGQGFDRYEHDEPLARTLAWLERAGPDPFFLFFHTYEVHDPYAPPARQIARFTSELPAVFAERVRTIRSHTGDWESAHRLFWDGVDTDDPAHVRAVTALYDAGIRRMDEQTLTPLLDALDRLGLAERTLVVLTSDHGDAFAEHGVFLHDDVYFGTLHVPLVLRLPGRLPAGRRIPAPVALLDLTPTILDLLGLPIPHGSQGRSLLPLVDGTTTAAARPVVSEYLAPDGTAVAEAVRDGERSYVRHGNGEYLFDLRTDPGERRNRATEEPHRLTERREVLRAWRRDCATVAARHPPARNAQPPDEHTRHRLEALGYIQ